MFSSPRGHALFWLACFATSASAQLSSPVSITTLNTPATQDFNTLATSGTSSTTPPGFGFVESGSNANTTYTAGSGSSGTGDTYSFGTGTNSDRAFGGLLSGTVTPTIGAAYTNNTGSTVTSLDISYNGEQWRLGATARADRLDFQYSTSATSLTTGTWTDVDSLDFTGPVTAGTVGALDGNAAANRTAKSFSITGLSIVSGATFYLRWNDFNGTGADDGLAIDDFSLTAQGSAPVNTPPNLAYNPALASTITLSGGVVGATGSASISVTPSGGSGSGADATTLVNACAITGAGASAFGAVSGQPLSFVGTTNTAQNLGLSCTVAAGAASAALDCTETRGSNPSVTRSWTLTCPAATPDIAPTVTTTTPANGATGVVATSNLVVNFSESVSTTSGWFALNCTSSGNVTYTESGSGNTRTLNPDPTLVAGESCTGSVESTQVSDLDLPVDFMAADFSFSFTVAGAAGGAPTVTFTAPVADQNPVRRDADVTVIFSESVTATASAFTLNCSISGAHPGTATSDAVTTTRYRFNPNTDFLIGDICTFTVVASQVTDLGGTPMAANLVRMFTVGDYYASVNATSTGANLRSTLHPLIDQHTVFSYSQAWGILEIADQAPDNFNQILDVYKNRRYNKVSDRAGTGSGVTYNREHTWPNSLGFSSSGETPYTDTHMLYLSDTQYNANRSNFPYKNCPNTGGSPCGEDPTETNFGIGGGSGTYPGNGNWGNNAQYETWNARKGDVARAVLYMDVRYEGTNGEDQLTLGESTSTAGQMASLAALRAWHQADPPDAAERLRNDIIYAYQGNRNPYIDHPEYVECIYGNVCAGANVPPNLAYSPNFASTIVFSSGTLGATGTASILVTPSGGSDSGTDATTSLSSCAITGAGFGAVSPATSSYVGSTTTAQTLNLSCTIAAGLQAGTLNCNEILGTAPPVVRSWPVQCPAASGSNVPPNLSFNPVSGSTLNLSGGGPLGSVAGASVAVTPSGGSGSGALATTTVNGCALSGAGAASFASVLNLQLNFVGNTTSVQGLPVSCTRGTTPATASLSCNISQAGAAASVQTFNLICPAASSAGGNLISLSQTGVAYTQNFDSLQSASFNSALPQGWRFSESGTNADTTYRASTGSSNAGDTYAFGPGACDRALGSLLTTGLQSRVGACFVNNTGRTLNTLRLNYVGEHWRRGAASGTDLLEFQYLVNPLVPGVSDATGTWLDGNALDFSNPVASGTANSSLDGNAAANRAARNADLSGLGVAAGESFCIRWLDTDMAAGSDHGLAVDDFSLIAEPEAAPGACSGLCVGDVAVTEGNSGTTNAIFNVTLSTPAPVGGVQFDVRTTVESASHFDNDYVYLEQSNLSITAGASSTTVTVLVNGDTMAEAIERFRLVLSNVRGVSVGDAIGVGTINTDDAYELWQVQTDGDRSPLDGQVISTQQNVVTAVDSNGFFMQTPDARSDGDLRTSDAVFVFTGSAPSVTAGQSVNVSGTVQERFCSTQINASGGGSVSATGPGTALAPLSFNVARPSPNLGSPSCAVHPDPETANFECFEHMLVGVQDGFVQGGNQRFPSVFSPPGIPGAATGTTDVMAEPLVTAGGARLMRGPGFLYPGFDSTQPYPDYNPADPAQVARVGQVPVWGGVPQVFELDPDALSGQPNQVLYAGQRFSAVGVLSYEFDDFELWPTSLTVASPAPPYPRSLPAATNGEMSLASLNLLRYYGANGTGLDVNRCDGLAAASYDSYSTGATGIAEVTRRRNKLARYIIDVMRSPDVLAVQEAENLAVLQALANELNTRDATLGYSGYLVLGNDRSGINPGYLVRDGAGGATARVDSVVVDQLGFSVLQQPENTTCLHDRPPLRLRANYVPSGQPFSVINNHTRSLLGIDEANDNGERVRRKRLQQATDIRSYIDSEMTSFPGRPVIVVGDHNAFQFSDGFVDTIGVIRGIERPALLASPPALAASLQLSNAIDLIDPSERYSYLFDNAAQVLDHALLNDAARAAFSGFAFARNNVDAPAHLFGLAENTCSNVDIDPSAGSNLASVGSAACTEGLSDHEGFVLRLFGSPATVEIVAGASQLEGNSGSTAVNLNLTLSGAFPAPIVRVPFQIVGGSATAGVDYQLVGPNHVDLTSALNPRALNVQVLGDTLLESDETIDIELGQPTDISGNPLNVSLSPNARRAQIRIVNDDALAAPVPARIGRADRGASGGDFVSQSLTGSAREYRYVIEVPREMASVNVELFDADFGLGGASDPADVPAAASFDPASSVRYRVLNPNGVELAVLDGTPSAPLGSNGTWSNLLTLNAPSPGRFEVRVVVPGIVVDSNGYRVRARGLRNARGGGGAAELAIYSDGYASIGHPASGGVGTTNDIVYPYVTEGCMLRTRTFDFDSASTSLSSIGLNAPNAFSQLYGDAQLSGDAEWNTLDSSTFTTTEHANGYGIWSAALTIEGGGGTANQATLYFGSTAGLSGNTAPAGSPPPNSFRIYQTENGAAPLKPRVRQQLFHVSGSNPPSPGNPGIYRVSIQLQNPGAETLRFVAADQLVRALVPFGGSVRYQGGAQPSQGSLLTEPTLGGAGEVTWNPGDIQAGDNVELTYLVEVAPSVAGVTQVTGTAAGNTGTTARFVDETNTPTQFGPLCELSLNSAGTPVPTPVTLASMRSAKQGNSVAIDFSVATQIGVAAYRIHAGNGDLRTPVGALLAASGDSLAPVSVSTRVNLTSNSFYLEVLDVDGKNQWFGPFAVGASEGQAVDLPAIDWSSLRAEAQGAQQRAATRPSADLARLRLRVARTGPVRVSGAEILAVAPALGRVPLAELELRDGASLVPIAVDSGDAQFSADDTLWFFARALERNESADSSQAWLYGGARTYTLKRGSGRLITASALPFTGTAVARFTRSALIEPQRIYAFGSPTNDPFAADRLLATPQSPVRQSYRFNLPDALAGPVTLTAELWGGADFPAIDDHRAELWAGAVRLSERRFDGLNASNLSAQLNHSGAPSLDVEVVLPGSNGQNFDLVLVDRLRADYQARLTASDGVLRMRIAQLDSAATDRLFADGMGDAPQALSGARFARAAGLTAGHRAWLLHADAAEALSTRVTDGLTDLALPKAVSGESELLAFNESAAGSASLLPWLDESALLSGQTDYLLIAHSQFSAGLDAFVAAKRAQGLTVKVASTEAIYQRFGNGSPDAAAISSYIRYAKTNLQTRFVLLVGGDTYDPRNHLGSGSLSFVPTPYVNLHPLVRFGASDAAYADTDGDASPDVALGRWPVRSGAELAQIVAKSLQPSNNRRALMLADDRDVADAFSFAGTSDRVIAALSPQSAQRAFLDELSPAQAKARLLERVAANDRLIHYFGHSGPTTWSYPAPGILSPSEIFAGALTNSSPNLLVQWGCWNSYHVIPQYNTLAHAWLLGAKGANAVIGAAAITEAANDAVLAELLASELKRQPTIGEALLAAKRELALRRPDARDVLLGTTLLGDPALRY